MPFEPGTYTIANLKSGAALDLSGGDHKSIISFPAHGGENQQWEATPLGSGWALRNVSTGGYLTVELGIGNGVPVVANAYPVAWAVEEADLENAFRIMWPNTSFVFDLEHGSSRPGTKIQLWELHPASDHQKWVFALCQCEAPEIVEVTSTPAGTTRTTTTTVTTTTVTTTVTSNP